MKTTKIITCKDYNDFRNQSTNCLRLDGVGCTMYTYKGYESANKKADFVDLIKGIDEMVVVIVDSTFKKYSQKFEALGYECLSVGETSNWERLLHIKKVA